MAESKDFDAEVVRFDASFLPICLVLIRCMLADWSDFTITDWVHMNTVTSPFGEEVCNRLSIPPHFETYITAINANSWGWHIDFMS